MEGKKDEVSLGAVESKSHIDLNLSGEDAVAKTLQALQSELQDRPAVEASVKTGKKKATKKATKKPTKKSDTTLHVTKKKPAAALRRPAASAASARGTARDGESRDARRLRLINVFVPKNIQEKYRDGCSKCYYRSGCTLSCWKLRGFEMSD